MELIVRRVRAALVARVASRNVELVAGITTRGEANVCVVSVVLSVRTLVVARGASI